MNEFTESRLTFPGLFSRFERVEIPIIQRDYAQGRNTAEDVRAGLLEAMFEALQRDSCDEALPLDLDFVYGSISTITKGDVKTTNFAPLDGQQRLTTLFLLHWFAAWTDGSGEEFKAVYRKAGKSRFAYLVRPSSTEFFDTLSAFFPDLEDIVNGKLSVSKYLEEQPWFFLYWKQDPTIQSALVMLDAIQMRFGKASGLYSKLTDEDVPRITFQFLNLEQFGLSDDLYIKMNARGKPLTAFENFKAKLEQKLASDFPDWKEKEATGRVPVKDYFSHRIETRWADLFWHYRDLKSCLFDDKIMALYRELAIVTRAPEDERFEVTIQDLRGQKGGFTYQWLAKIGAVDEAMLRSLFGTLDQLSGSHGGLRTFLKDKAYLDEANLFEGAIDPRSSLNYEDLILFRAYTGYLVAHREGIDSDSLWNWGRVIANLARNTIYNRPEDFQRSLRSVNVLLEHADQILEFLATDAESVAGLNQQQVREEQLKAQLILRSDKWKDLIIDAECHGYFAGQIEFLFKFCGLLDQWLPERICEWSEAEDEKFREQFKVYHTRAISIFSDDGLKDFDGFLWERALLSEGDYLVESGPNHCLLRSDRRDTSWKRLLRGDPKKPEEENRRNVVLRVMDRLNDDTDAAASLQSIIDMAQVDETWRRFLVEHPEAIGYCDNRLIRWKDDGQIYLLKRSQLNGMHADLFSYCLFVGEFQPVMVDNGISPYPEILYRSPTHTWSEPCIVGELSISSEDVEVQILDGGDEGEHFVISVPTDSRSLFEDQICPALEVAGYQAVDKRDESKAMEKSVPRNLIVEQYLEIGQRLLSLNSE